MKPRILVVDDSLTVRMDLKEALSAGGLEVVVCASVAEARAELGARSFDAAILDVLLPDGDGVELLAELRYTPATAALPVMLLSTEAEVADRIRGLGTGADDYIGKPYQTHYVVSRVRELVRQRALPHPSPVPPRVLVVDDSVTQRSELGARLRDAGYEVIEAGDGEQGLALAALERPDAVIVDNVMPGIDGKTLIRRLRADSGLRKMPCLLLTASDETRDELEALDAGADAYLRKGEGDEVVLTRLAAVLRSIEPSPLPAASSSGLLGLKRILAVDDSQSYLCELSSELHEEGYDVITAHSGEEALALLEVQSVDCILLDLMMPGLSGEETCRRIKVSSDWRRIPLIILTGRQDQEAMILSINAGADDYIPKSDDFLVLRARLRAQLRRKQFEDENRTIREELLRRELDARAARQLADAKAMLLSDLEKKHAELGAANEALRRAREQAQKESRFKSRFLASMSHELRTPLNAIIGFSELLEQEIFGTLNERQKGYIKNVLSSGRHLLQLIDDVLDISKVEAGKLELRREWIGVGSVLEAAVDVARPLAERRDIQLDLVVPEAPQDLYADPLRLKQVLYNLLSNAIKFTPRGGRVSVTSAVQERFVELAVTDTGIGIRAEDLPRLFREFERIEPASGPQPEGTGLGLALSRRLVEMHGGSIGVESEPGRGSTFSVRLPLLGMPPPSAAPASGNGEPRVLVVEDDPAGAELIAGQLRAAGLAVSIARDAEQAVRLAGELKPVAVTLDILMPGIDGWAVLDRLKSSPLTASIPVVVVSVVDESQRGLVLGATDYLVKPVSREILLSSLDAVGVPLRQVAGLKVLLVGEGSGELDRVEGHLRHAGCIVRRVPVLDADALAGPERMDIALVDVWNTPQVALDELADLTADVPVLALLEAGDARDGAWRERLSALARADALRPERLVRALWCAAGKDRALLATEAKP